MCIRDRLDAINDGDEMVSSTSIRRLLQAGAFAKAIQRLGHPYRLTGTVVRGAGRGRDLGFPTANLEQIAVLVPGDGVYAAAANIDGMIRPVAVNIGPNPTFGEQQRKVECHVPGYSGNLYGATLDVDLTHQIRGLVQFESVDSLRDQITKDVAEVIALADR